MSVSAGPVRPGAGRLAAIGAAALLCLASGLPASAQDDEQSADVAEPCEPAQIPFDAENLRLTGNWGADDDGVYYIRQVGNTIWWTGMSGRDGSSADLGRDFDNVAHGTLKGNVLGLDFADVPRGNMWGQGHLAIRAEADEDGNLQLRRITGDFGATTFTPCAPTSHLVETFARPYAYTVPFGEATATWPGAADQDVIITPDIPNSGLTTWLLGAGWQAHCGLTGPLQPLAPGPDGLIDYLRTLPDIEVSEPVSVRVDGNRGSSVDVTSKATASGCDGDRYIRLWKESDREAGLQRGRDDAGRGARRGRADGRLRDLEPEPDPLGPSRPGDHRLRALRPRPRDG